MWLHTLVPSCLCPHLSSPASQSHWPSFRSQNMSDLLSFRAFTPPFPTRLNFLPPTSSSGPCLFLAKPSLFFTFQPLYRFPLESFPDPQVNLYKLYFIIFCTFPQFICLDLLRYLCDVHMELWWQRLCLQCLAQCLAQSRGSTLANKLLSEDLNLRSWIPEPVL